MKSLKLSLIYFFTIILVITGCVPTNPMPTQIVEETTLPSTATITLTPIKTTTSTPTFTPSPTPKLTWPVFQNTPIPDSLFPQITVRNLDSIHEIAKYGSPTVTGCNILNNNEFGSVIASLDGFHFFNKNTADETSFFPAMLNIYSGNFFFNGLQKQGFMITPDGKFILGITKENQLSLWTDTGEKVFSYDLPIVDGRISSTISPNGEMVALSTCNQSNVLSRVNFLNDWDFLETSCETKIINVASNEVIHEFHGRHPSFSPDGTLFVVFNDSNFKIFSTSDWTLVNSIFQKSNFANFSFSPSGQYLFVNHDKSIDLYNIPDFKLARRFDQLSADKIAFSDDEKYILINSDTSTSSTYQIDQYVYEISTGNIENHYSENINNGCIWFDSNQNMKFAILDNSYQPDYSVMDDKFQGDQQDLEPTDLAITNSNVPDRINIVRNGNQVTTINGLDNNWLVAESNDIAIIASSVNGPGQAMIQMIDLSTGERIAKWNKTIEETIQGQKYLVIGIVSNTQARSRSDYALVVIDTQSKKVVLEKESIPGPYMLDENNGLISYLDQNSCLHFESFSETNAPAAFCFTPKPGIYDEPERIYSADITPDKKIAAFASEYGDIYFIDLNNISLLYVLHTNSGWIRDLFFSDDGTLLVSFSPYESYTTIWGVDN